MRKTQTPTSTHTFTHENNGFPFDAQTKLIDLKTACPRCLDKFKEFVFLNFCCPPLLFQSKWQLKNIINNKCLDTFFVLPEFNDGPAFRAGDYKM